MVERQARDVEVQGSNPGPGSNFSIEFEFKIVQCQLSPVLILESIYVEVLATF